MQDLFSSKHGRGGVCRKAYFLALNTKLSILANFKDKELIHFMSDLAIERSLKRAKHWLFGCD
jgi:hypothetical protein